VVAAARRVRAAQPVAELLFSPADATPMSTDEATVMPWDQALGQLAAAPKYWLATTSPVMAFGYGPDGLTATRWRFTGP